MAREVLFAQPLIQVIYRPPAKRIFSLPAAPLSDDTVHTYDMAHLAKMPTSAKVERLLFQSFEMGILIGLGWMEGTDLKGQKLQALERKRLPRPLGFG